MTTKAERTSAFIIETVAPIFTKQGYVGTSMSDLTLATGLTKGALYGNFKNKEELAVAAFEYNSKILLSTIDDKLTVNGSSLDRLLNLMEFYRTYDDYTEKLGGCPILMTGVDSLHNNEILSSASKETVRTIEGKIALVIENGSNNGDFKLAVSPLQFAKQLFTMIQGAVTMNAITGDSKYLLNTVGYLQRLVKNELKN